MSRRECNRFLRGSPPRLSSDKDLLQHFENVRGTYRVEGTN